MFTADTAATGASAVTDRDAARSRPLLDPVLLFTALWRAKAFIILLALVGAALGAAYAVSQPKIYSATTQILVDPRDLNVVQNEVTPNGLPTEATLALVQSQIAVVYSNELLSKAVAAEGLTTDPEFSGEVTFGPAAILASINRALFGEEPALDARWRELATVIALRKNLEVYRDPNSFILNLSVRSRDPEKAARLSRRIAALFIADTDAVQADTARRATQSLSSRLEELRASVVAAERAVEDYKAENALVGVGGRLVDDDYILRMNDQLARARADITALRVRAESMAATSVDDVVRGTFPEELTSEALNRLRVTYAQLEQDAAVLAARLGPRHPQRMASDDAVASARAGIEAELDRIIAAAQTELQRAARTEEALTAEIDGLKTKQISTSGSFVRLRELEREVEASRAVYEAFLLRARETGEQEGISTANVRIVSEAVPPFDPVSLSRKVVVAAGALIGAGLAAVLVVVRALVRGFGAAPADRRPVASAAPAQRRDELPAPRDPEPSAPSAGPGPETALAPEGPGNNEGGARALGFAAPPLDASSDSFFDEIGAGRDEGERRLPLLPPSSREGTPEPTPRETPPAAGRNRASLREAIRNLGRVEGTRDAAARENESAEPPLDAEVQQIKGEIDAVKHQIALLRERRQRLPA